MKRGFAQVALLTSGFLLGAPASSLMPASAAAATFPREQPFTQSAFDAAQKDGRPILLHITAPWCTTCAAQKPILEHLLSEPGFKPVQTFNIDFDTQKKLVSAFGARVQSTLIVFKGREEEGRSSGDTDKGSIRTLLAKAL